MNYKEYFPVEEYYRKVVKPINPHRFKYGSGGKMVCPLHDDHDPSLGVIESKNGEICHCFGCGAWCDVVDLHIRVSKIYKKKYLDREESRKELCKIFGINSSDLPEEDIKDGRTNDEKREELIKENMSKFDISDFRYKLLDGKLKKRGIGYFNALMMSMLWESKNGEKEK